MKKLIENGNIFVLEKPYECLCCFESGYFRYVGEYTMLRKYATTSRFYVDFMSYLYKEPVSKIKNPEVLVKHDEHIPEGKNYYVRVCGTSKKVLPPSMYMVKNSSDAITLINQDVFKLINALSWQNKPQINPVQIITTSNTVASAPGDFYMLRVPSWWYSDFLTISPYVDWRTSYFSSVSIPGLPIFETIYEKRVLDLFHADIISYSGQLYETEKPTRPVLSHPSELLFSLNAVKKLVSLDSVLVFAPVHVTELPIEDFIQRRDCIDKEYAAWRDKNLYRSIDEVEVNMREQECYKKLREYLKKWAKEYDAERFDRFHIRVW